jgi:hypothetical protein
MGNERGFIVFSRRDQLTGVVSGFLSYDGNGDSVALEKVGRDRGSQNMSFPIPIF